MFLFIPSLITESAENVYTIIASLPKLYSIGRNNIESSRRKSSFSNKKCIFIQKIKTIAYIKTGNITVVYQDT